MIYADSSFFVACYIEDAHSAAADRLRQSASSICPTPFHRAEIAHAMHQGVFRKKLSLGDAQLVWAHFEQDCQTGVWRSAAFPERTWLGAVDLARRYGPDLGVRTLDSLHVACALEVGALRFWTFDERQARLAALVGLRTEEEPAR